MSCGMKCIKLTLFIFNFFFVLIGLAFIISAAYMLVAFRHFLGLVPGTVTGAVLVIVIGVLIFIPAFCGCCGALRESRCMLITYAVLMGILLLIEVIIAIAGFVYSSKVRGALEVGLKAKIEGYTGNVDNEIMVDFMQATLSCCGSYGPQDWAGQLGPNSTHVPLSCCLFFGENSKTNKTCNTDGILKEPEQRREEIIYTKGCTPRIEVLAKSFIHTICAIAVTIAVIELLVIVLALCLANSAGQHD